MKPGTMRMGLALCLGTLVSCQMVAGIEETRLSEVDAGGTLPVDGAPADAADDMPQEYVVRGMAGGVRESVALRLEFTGGSELLSVTGDGPFAFETKLAQGASYTVVFVGAPPCLLDNATGALAGGDAELSLACNGAAMLSELTLSGPAVPDLGFSPGKLEYTVEISLLQQSITLSPATTGVDTTITIAGQPVTSDAASAPLAMDLGDNQVEVVASHPSGLKRTYRVTVRRAATLAQYAYGKASNTGGNDRFGFRVALSGDTLAVGADYEDSGAVGVGGSQTDESARDSGAVYVFRRSGASWSQEAYLKASNTGAYDRFGHSLALSGDTLAVSALGEDSGAVGVGGNQGDDSAPNSGAVYVFHRSGSSWTQEAYLKASNAGAYDGFGYGVSLNGDTLAVGAPIEASGAVGVGGDQFDESAVSSGAVYVFRRSGASWSQEAYLKASNTSAGARFGINVSLSGDTLAVGADGEGSGVVGVSGDQADNSAPDSGAVYVFRNIGTSWSQEAYFKASNAGAYDYFGNSVSLSGDVLAVGAYGEDSGARGVDGSQGDDSAAGSGAVYVFRRSGTSWTQEAYLKALNADAGDQFGDSLALSGDLLVVGAYIEDSGAVGVGGSQGDNSAPGSGAVYVFRRSGGSWSQEAYVKASNTGAGRLFGWTMALSDDTLAVGAYGEASGAVGVGGDQGNDNAPGSGAVYIFH